MPDLSEEEEAIVDEAFGLGSPDAVLSSSFNIDITRKDVSTLSGSGWLNDEVGV